MEYNESPLLLLVNCEMASEMRDLPVYVYETVLHIVEDLPVMAFARVPYRIESEEVCLCVMLGVFHLIHCHCRMGVCNPQTSLQLAFYCIQRIF